MGSRKNDRRKTRELAWVLSGSLLAFYVGMRWGMLAETHHDVAEGLAESLSADLVLDVLMRPLAASLDVVPLLCGMALFCVV
ncbi:MAG: hypothetical protein IKE22_12120 [Atopobiaceae bacterium]|nr:hypothetical protein [Atopobiaceae bacterium]